MGNKVLRYKQDLYRIVGADRVFFEEEVRRLYNHDISNPPKIPLDIMIKRMPGAVVVPNTKEQLAELCKWATTTKTPLTPRAAGSSAYGGAVPVRGGVVVDMRHFSKRIDIDAAKLTATVDPAVVIWDLEGALRAKDLMLLTYPTSAPSATIGGFVAQGGVGMGSYEHGPIARQVLAAEIVLPNGEVKTFTGRELDVVNDCEGITGFITSVTIRVGKREPKVPVLVTYDNIDAVSKGVAAFQKLRVWNLTVHNPTFTTLREEAGGPKTVPARKYSVLAVFRKSQLDAQKDALAKAITESGGKQLPDAVAEKDWGEIFNTLRAKRLGPSLAPGEVVFPSEGLAKFLKRLEDEWFFAEVSIEATVIDGGYITVLAFGLEDERRLEYPVGFALGMKVLEVGKALGGRAYAPGLYLAGEAERVFGATRYDRIVAFKKAVDKSKIMNPGKIVGIPPRGAPPPPLTPPFMNVDRTLNAKPARMLMKFMAARYAHYRTGDDRFAGSAQRLALTSMAGGDFGAKHGWAVYSCSQCGFCREATPLAEAVGYEGGASSGLVHWAKLYLDGKFKPTKMSGELIAAAAGLQDAGDLVCPSSIPLTQLFKDFKAQIEADTGVKLVVSGPLQERIRRAEAKFKAKREAAPLPAAAALPKPVPVAVLALKAVQA